MGTRGNYIFRYKGKCYVFYNHFDSYFSGLGEDIVRELKSWTAEDFELAKVLLDRQEGIRKKQKRADATQETQKSLKEMQKK